MALGCFHPIAKVQNAAIHFFLGADDEDEDSESEDEVSTMCTIVTKLTLDRFLM